MFLEHVVRDRLSGHVPVGDCQVSLGVVTRQERIYHSYVEVRDRIVRLYPPSEADGRRYLRTGRAVGVV